MLMLGCGGASTYFADHAWWPILPVPQELVLSGDDEKAILTFAAEHPKTFGKIKKQSDAYKAIILKYNELARKHNKEGMEALGLDKEKVKEIYGDEKD